MKGARVVVAAALLPTLTGVTGCMRYASTTDMARFYRLSVAVQPVSTNVDWRLPTSADSICGAVELDTGDVLVATSRMVTSLNAYARQPRIAQLRLVRPGRGVAWQAEVDAPAGPLRLVSNRPLIVQMPGQLHAFDPDSGSPLWHAEALQARSCPAGVCVQTRDGVRLLDPASGHERWRLATPDSPRALEIVTDCCFVLTGSSLHCVGLVDGQERGSPLAVDRARQLASATGAGGVLLLTATGIQVVDANGRRTDSRELEGVDRVFPTTAGYYVTRSNSDGESGEVLRFSPGGQLRWSASLRGSLFSPCSHQGNCLVATARELHVIDDRTGRIRRSVTKPRGLETTGLLDRFVPVAGGAIVVGENGVARLDADSGRWRWALALNGTQSASLAGRANLAREATARLVSMTGARNAATVRAIADASALNSPHNPTLAIPELRGAAVGLAAFGAAVAAATAMNTTALSQRIESMWRQPTWLHSASVQGDYFVRPLAWTFGRGFVVVRLSDGAWQEIVTAPGEPLADEWFLGSPLPVRVGDQWLSLGLAGSPEEWRMARVYPAYSVALPDLVSYRLDPQRFRAPAEYAADSVVPTATAARRFW